MNRLTIKLQDSTDREYTVAQFMEEHPRETADIQAILVEYWDPMEVVDPISYRGEYDTFVPMVALMGMEGGSVAGIADCLEQIQMGIMGVLESTPQHWLRCKRAAEAVVEYFRDRAVS